MSVTPAAQAGQGSHVALRLCIALTACAIVAGVMLLLAALLAGSASAPPPRSPFGVGPREAAPTASGIGLMIMQWQSGFYRDLTGALRSLRDSWAAIPALLGLGFAYGVVHAAGPGHGKAVISAYILSDDRSVIWRGFSLSLAAALVQACVAIGLVLLFAVVLGATSRQMSDATSRIEMAAFAAIALLGLVLLWQKAGVLLAASRGEPAACAPGCGHDVMASVAPARPWRQTAMVVLAAGIRPCAGAIIVLVFALSQKLLWAGIATTLAMALGTALTTGAIALLAVLAKGLALKLAGGRGNRAAVAIRALECLAAAFVAALGALLLFGYWSAGAG